MHIWGGGVWLSGERFLGCDYGTELHRERARKKQKNEKNLHSHHTVPLCRWC